MNEHESIPEATPTETVQPPTPEPPAPMQGYQPQPPQPGQAADVPGKGLGIAGFILALIGLFTFGFTSLIGLILSIIGRVKSKKAGQPSGLALAGIIISAISMVIGLIIGILVVVLVVNVAMQYNDKCTELGVGTHQNVEILGATGTLTCGADGSADWSSESSWETKSTYESDSTPITGSDIPQPASDL